VDGVFFTVKMLSPLAPQFFWVEHLHILTGGHPSGKIFLFTHSHGEIPRFLLK